MNYFLLLLFFVLTLQRFVIIQTRQGNCQGKITNGAVYTTEKCLLVDFKEKHYAKINHKETSFTIQTVCNERCTSCLTTTNYKYECTPTRGGATDVTYGVPQLTEFGFYYKLYNTPEDCQKDIEPLDNLFFTDKFCFTSGGFSQFKSKSQYVQFDIGRNVGIFEEYEELDCKGPSKRHFIPLNQCTRVPGQPIFVKVKRNL